MANHRDPKVETRNAHGGSSGSTLLRARERSLPKASRIRARIPIATYRLQFNPGFTFCHARQVVPYLNDLGVTDCYASPFLKARPGSTHGYDVCDHNSLNPELGDASDYDRFVEELHNLNMGQIMDVVPNHVGIGSINAAWMDVLENGESSPYARHFDIDWHPLMAGDDVEHRVLLPILGEPFGKVLEGGQLHLAFEEGTFFVHYFDTHKLPIAPCSQTGLLSRGLDLLAATLGADHQNTQEYQSIITALGHLPSRTTTDTTAVAERQREKEVIKRRLDSLYSAHPAVAQAIADSVALFNGRPGDPRSFDLLEALLNQQSYRLAFWRVAADEINYRRFFDINDLAALRMEDPDIFRQTHGLILRLLEEGKVTGLRIDHPDGLWDPAGYFHELQQSYLKRLACRSKAAGECRGVADRHADDLGGDGRRAERADLDSPPLYMVVEKILAEGERLRREWPVFGTTGYEFANAVNGLFVARGNKQFFDNIYSAFTGSRVSFPNLVNSLKKMIMLVSLASEVNLLGYQLKRIASRNRWHRDFTLNSLTFALREVIASLPVYRTYVAWPVPGADRQDRSYIEAAVADAKRRNPRTATAIFDFLADILLQPPPSDLTSDEQRQRASFVMKFQQTTGPVMAKGVEDTAFYVYNRLTSLNEVGGNPDQFGITVTAFHRQNADRLRFWPHSLNCSSTHDTKRSEDVRARIDVLSEIPRQWKAALERWTVMNRPKKNMVDGHLVPDANEEYLLYQALLGAWPLEPIGSAVWPDFVERIHAYMEKATREAKVNTSWINPNEAHDAAVSSFVRSVLDHSTDNPFLEDIGDLQRFVAHFGAFNSLAQTLLKITSPGVPDTYQGTELWDFSLVDPDNRRPVDFVQRASLLRALQLKIAQADGKLEAIAAELLDTKTDGRVKLYVTHLALRFRRDHPALFQYGAYLPLQSGGSKRNHVVAFARSLSGQTAVVAAPRLVALLTGGVLAPPLGEDLWKDTWLAVPRPPGKGRHHYRNVFTGELLHAMSKEGRLLLPASAVFRTFPLALLEVATGFGP